MDVASVIWREDAAANVQVSASCIIVEDLCKAEHIRRRKAFAGLDAAREASFEVKKGGSAHTRELHQVARCNLGVEAANVVSEQSCKLTSFRVLLFVLFRSKNLGEA
jgi:hypothetical protein